MEDVETRVKQIRNLGLGAGTGLSQSPETLRAIESALGVTLPRDYRAFIEKYGYLHITDVCVSGVADTDPLAEIPENVVFATRDARRNLGVPDHLLVIRRDHEDHGYAICLDLRANAQQPPVVCWNPSKKTTVHWYSSFEEFLEKHILAGWEDA